MSKPNKTTGNENGGTGEFIDPAAATGNGTGSGDGGSGDGSVIRDANGTEFDGSIHIHPDKRNADGSFRRKRGRRGSGSKSKSQVYSDIEKSAEMLTKGLVVFHATLAAMTKTPELVLAEEEAKGLSESGLTLLSMYDIKPDPKVEAAILFAGQIGLIYGTRIVAIKARKAHEREAERKGGTAVVYDANGFATGTTPFHETGSEETPLN